jgi:prolyl-tRNA synthetase
VLKVVKHGGGASGDKPAPRPRQRRPRLRRRQIADIAAARSDPYPRCGAPLEVARGIEVGNIFKLGTKLLGPDEVTPSSTKRRSEADGDGLLRAKHRRTVAQSSAEPRRGRDRLARAARLSTHLIAMNVGDEANRTEADRVYAELSEKGIEVLYDDRDERPGVKFKDADLVGLPLKVTVGGRSLKEGKIEVSRRRDRSVEPVSKEQAVEAVVGAVRQAQKS